MELYNVKNFKSAFFYIIGFVQIYMLVENETICQVLSETFHKTFQKMINIGNV